MDQTILVELETAGTDYELEIEEVYALGDQLIVISELEKGDKDIGDKAVRVSDQIVINAPDLSVRHYIIGTKPERSYNDSYRFIDDKSSIASRLDKANKIYG